MNLEEMKRFVITCSGYLHHVGMLVESMDKTIAAFKLIPGIGEWTTGDSVWSDEEMVTGRGNTMICSTARVMDSILMEVIEPVQGKCEGTHFAEYLEKYGEGLHHLCYGFPHYEDFLKVYQYFTKEGYRDLIHGRKHSEDGKITDEYCYIEIPGEKMYIELNWTRYKWGY